MIFHIGFPERFNTVEEVIKFITMVIFTITAQHSAVNTGQVGNRKMYLIRFVLTHSHTHVYIRMHTHNVYIQNIYNPFKLPPPYNSRLNINANKKLFHNSVRLPLDAQWLTPAAQCSSDHEGTIKHGVSFGGPP